MYFELDNDGMESSKRRSLFLSLILFYKCYTKTFIMQLTSWNPTVWVTGQFFFLVFSSDAVVVLPPPWLGWTHHTGDHQPPGHDSVYVDSGRDHACYFWSYSTYKHLLHWYHVWGELTIRNIHRGLWTRVHPMEPIIINYFLVSLIPHCCLM